MIFFFSVPLWLGAIIITVWAFTHPQRATLAIARFLLGLIGFLLILASLLSFTMLREGPVMVIGAVLVWVSLVACFVARNKLSKL